MNFRKNARQYGMLIALAAIWIIFALATNGIFISPRNLSNLFLQTATVGIAAAGMVLVIVTGNIDLSVGSVAGFTGAVAAVLQVRYGWHTWAALSAALACGAAIGAWHGFWVAYKKVPAFIVTLASMLIFRGAILGITGGATIGPLAENFKAVGQESLPQIFFKGAAFNDLSLIAAVLCAAIFVFFELRKIHGKPTGGQIARLTLLCAAIFAAFLVMAFNRGVPYCVLLLLGVAAALSFLANHTVFGRRLYAIGANADAARLSGVNISSNVAAMFALFGGLTALSGVVMTARLNAATTSAGVNMELDAIAAAVIGGTSLMGGEGTVAGALVGALVMSSLDNGMSLLNLDITYQYLIKGLILLLAVWADIAARRES